MAGGSNDWGIQWQNIAMLHPDYMRALGVQRCTGAATLQWDCNQPGVSCLTSEYIATLHPDYMCALGVQRCTGATTIQWLGMSHGRGFWSQIGPQIGPKMLREAVRTLLDVSGRFGDAPGTLRERSGDAPGTLRGAPVTLRDAPGELRGRSGDAPERSPDVPERPQELFASPIGVQDVRRSFFACFLCVARYGQSGFRIGFYSTLSMSDDVRVERSGAPKTIEKPSVLASKIEVRGVPGAVRASQNRSCRVRNRIWRPTNAQVTANKRPRRAKGG